MKVLIEQNGASFQATAISEGITVKSLSLKEVLAKIKRRVEEVVDGPIEWDIYDLEGKEYKHDS